MIIFLFQLLKHSYLLLNPIQIFVNGKREATAFRITVNIKCSIQFQQILNPENEI